METLMSQGKVILKKAEREESNRVAPNKNLSDHELLDRLTGITRTVICYDNQGFRNFRILTLHLNKGKIEKIDRSDPYASFEAISRMELWNEMSVINLNNNWAHDKILKK